MSPRAGLLVRRAGELAFLSASVARKLVPLPRLTKIPWDTAQMALVGGEVLAVLELGAPSGQLVVCEVEGQALALSGLSAERAGFWPEHDSGVNVDGEHVPALDLAAALKHFRPIAEPTKDEAP